MRMMIAAALALAACTPATAPETAATGETASVRGCQAVATAPWRPLSGVEYSVEAYSNGPDCEHAVATLVVRNPNNEAIWVDAAATTHLMTLAPARDAEALQTALSEWITPGSTIQTTSALPGWPANANAPQSGEFPFYPESYIDRATYNDLRGRNLPVYCYVQGMESLACLVLRDGQLEKIGVQSFPG